MRCKACVDIIRFNSYYKNIKNRNRYVKYKIIRFILVKKIRSLYYIVYKY